VQYIYESYFAALPDLVRLVHGNKFSIQKLVKEFREFWHHKEKCLNTCDEPAVNKCTVMEQEKVNIEPNITSIEPIQYEISKRQLDAKIRDIATYESRPQCYKRRLWYVSDAILSKFELHELPIPTQWVWTVNVSKD